MTGQDVDTDGRTYNRRKILASGAGVGAASALPQVAAADSDVPGEDSDSEDFPVTTLMNKKEFTLYRIDRGDTVSLGKFYTSGTKEGQLKHLRLTGNDVGLSVLSKDEDGVSVGRVAALDAVESQGVDIVKRSKNIDRADSTRATRTSVTVSRTSTSRPDSVSNLSTG